MVNNITSFRDGGTILVEIYIPAEFINIMDLPSSKSASLIEYKIYRDLRVGVSRGDRDYWIGYPGGKDSIRLNQLKHELLIAWVKDKAAQYVEGRKEYLNSFSS